MLNYRPEIWFKKKYDALVKSELYKNLNSICKELYSDRYELKLELYYEYNDDWGSFYHWYKNIKRNPFKITLIIHFPEVIVTNRKLMSHNVKDLYFIMSITKESNYSVAFSGFRTTYSIAELQSYYTHSHLSGTSLKSIKNWTSRQGWCLGASELVNYSTLINTDYNTIKMLLLLIPGYISYESIEGRPFKYISRLGLSDTGLNNCGLEYLDFIYSLYLKDIDFKKLKFDSEFNILNIEEFEELFSEIKDKTREYLIEKRIATWKFTDIYRCYKFNYKYYPINSEITETYPKLDNKFLFNFNNKPVYSKVENAVTEIKTKKYVHPQIIRYFAERISKEIREFFYNKYGEISTSNNTSESKRADTVLV